MPKADRDWKAYLRAKGEDRKKVDRQTRKFRPLTDEVVRGHLVGDHTIGIYPLLQDETCWFLAVDFDKKTWQKDANAFLAVCRELSVPAALERSRSGNGGHVWIFFDPAIPATTARKLGCVILTRAMESRHQLGLDSYYRFFPNQDTMPKGGLGNLIALPQQKLPRADGNSVFVDAEFRPYGDQWAFLASVKRMPASAAEAVVLEAQRNGDLIGVRISSTEDEGEDPWTLPPSRKRAERPIPGPLPAQVRIVRANDGTGWMASLMPLRSDLLRGDLRCLYLGWLRSAQDGGLDENEMEPPVPVGLQELSGSLDALIEFLEINADLVEVAAQASKPLAAGPSRKELSAWVRGLSEKDKNELLITAVVEQGERWRNDFMRRFRRTDLQQPSDVPFANERRKVGQSSGSGPCACEGESPATERTAYSGSGKTKSGRRGKPDSSIN